MRPVLHHPCPTADRPRPVGQALRRRARESYPRYNYDDMVQAQHPPADRRAGIKHVRLVMGNSMDGMHTWIWGVTQSGFHGRAGADGVGTQRDGEPQLDDAATDRFDSIRNDPEWKDRHVHHAAEVGARWRARSSGVATNGGTLAIRRPRDARCVPTSCSMIAWPRRFAPTPTTRCTVGQFAPTTTRRPPPPARTHRSRAAGDQRGRR